jgi:hypothetical protein
MTNIRPVPDDNDEPTDPYDYDNVRYTEAEFNHDNVNAKKETTSIRVRKPFNLKEWFMLHPGDEYQWPVAIYHCEQGDLKPEPYLVLPRFAPHFKTKDGLRSALTPARLRLAVNSLGTAFLWDMKVSVDGRASEHHSILADIADMAERAWVKLDWNTANRVYDYWDASAEDLGDPQWPQQSMRDLVKLGFKRDHVIDCDDHPVIAEFKGRGA